MAIPQIIFTACPGCGEALELTTMGWQVTAAEREDGHGIFLELAAFGGHVCWSEEA